MKLLLALQFHKGDFEQAMNCAELIADLQEKFCDNAEFLFFGARNLGKMLGWNRFVDVRNKIGKKFTVHSTSCQRRSEGWPAGPNDMWHDLLHQCYLLKRANRLKCDTIYTFEADAVPTNPDWINILLTEYVKSKDVMGNISTFNGKDSGIHVNGNLIMPIEFAYKNKMNSCPNTIAWDCYYSKLLVKNGHHSMNMVNDYRKKTVAEADLFRRRKDGSIATVHHGFKGNDVVDMVRKKYLTS